MTLIASFKINNIPVLIGDFLLTVNDPHNFHNFIPTKPELAKVKPAKSERRIYGLRKKIHIIGDRLAIGFTGDLPPGRYILRQIHDQFSNNKATVSKLKKLLSKIKCVNKSKTEFTGWIWEKKPICFYWNGKKPNDFILTNCIFGGSGGPHFRKSLKSANYAGLSPNLKTSFDKATYIGVHKSGSVLFEELSKAENLKYHYGFAAEIILWNGKRFLYNPKLSYAFLNIVIDQNNNLQIQPANFCCVYENFGKYSAVQVVHMEHKNKPALGLQAKNTYVTAITPLYDDMSTLDPKTIGQIPLDSKLWFTGIHVHNPIKNSNARLSVVSKAGKEVEQPIVEYKNGMLFFNIKNISNMLPAEVFN